MKELTRTEPIPPEQDLPNKPLLEAIYELHWQLASDSGGFETDAGFRFLLGTYRQAVRGTYPFAQALPAASVPEEATPYIVRHQFRSGRDQWPVTQIGPGVLTVNETAAYSWASFRPRLVEATDALFRSYPRDESNLAPKEISLRYINGLDFDPSSTPLIRYLADNLHTSLSLDDYLFDSADEAIAPLALSLSLTYPSKTPYASGIGLTISTGMRDNKPALIWEIAVRTSRERVPSEPNTICAWLDEAHGMADKWFRTLCRGKLWESFGGRNA